VAGEHLDTSALGRLYETHGYLVHRRCLSLLKSSQDADDALQEVFVRVQRYGRPAQLGSELAWLYSIAQNCCFDLMAHRGREESRPPHALERDASVSHGGPNDADRRALLGSVLARFDDTTRTIGVLHYLDGFTQEEVAERTGLSRKTVGKKLGRFEEAVTTLWREAHGTQEAAP
jgi:RNA polymerase sigma factor (sigma-70 family)